MIPASATVVFDHLVDYRRATQFIDGLERIQPQEADGSGIGARFDASMKVGPKSMATVISLVEAVPETKVVWASVEEDGQRLVFQLTPDAAANATDVSLEISYKPPGDLGGRLLAPVIEQTVRSRARASLDHLARLVSAQAL